MLRALDRLVPGVGEALAGDAEVEEIEGAVTSVSI
jgi:hypothetical protein